MLYGSKNCTNKVIMLCAHEFEYQLQNNMLNIMRETLCT